MNTDTFTFTFSIWRLELWARVWRQLIEAAWEVVVAVVLRRTLCEICHMRLKPRKLGRYLPLFERGFCKHLRMRERNLKPFIQSVRALRIHTRCFWRWLLLRNLRYPIRSSYQVWLTSVTCKVYGSGRRCLYRNPLSCCV